MTRRYHIQVASCALSAILYAATIGSAAVITNFGFEQPVSYLNWPNEYGVWGGDKVHSTAAQQGIVPQEGSRMLQFDATSWNGAGLAGASNVCQAVDVSSQLPLIRSGYAKVTASAYFNRVAGDIETDSQFFIWVYAYAGTVTDHRLLKESGSDLAHASNSFLSDGDPSSWETISVSLDLPANTDFIVVEIDAVENVRNDYSLPEFDGHYADQVSLALTPEPSTLMLLVIGVTVLNNKPTGK